MLWNLQRTRANLETFGRKSVEKTGGILKENIEEGKKEKTTLKTIIRKLRNEMAVWNYRRKHQTRKMSWKDFGTLTIDGTNC